MAATRKLLKAGGGQLRFEGPPWNDSTVDVIRSAKAHSVYVLTSFFSEAVAKLQVLGTCLWLQHGTASAAVLAPPLPHFPSGPVGCLPMDLSPVRMKSIAS